MHESFLHFLWRFQYFNKQNLYTVEGSQLQIVSPGIYNTHSGPDFEESRVLLDGMEWAGKTEIHLKSSDWLQHGHQTNEAYNNVILHVVWQHDQPVQRQDGTVIPTLELSPRTDVQLLHTYQSLLENLDPIPCASQIHKVPAIYIRQALDQALMQRLQEKARFIEELLHLNHLDWEETTWQVLARNLGFKVNSEPFLRLAKVLPLKILRKHGDSLLQMEALLFGQAGFLEQSFSDAYPLALQQEYAFLSRKYQLYSSRLSLHEWKFMRLRPSNFPTVRIAQLAALVHKHPHLFALFTHLQPGKALMDLCQISTSDYWQKHYSFEKTTRTTGHLGDSSIENILINTAVPLLVSYQNYRTEEGYTQHATDLLESLSPEDNTITRQWKRLQIDVRNAFDSQASIELFNRFCSRRECLTCPVGNYLLKSR